MKARIALVVGTRPDALKLAPVIRELRARPDRFDTIVIASGQHRALLDQALRMWDIAPDVDLALMRHDQAPVSLMASALGRVAETMARLRPDLLVVQGDTTTAVAGALAGMYQQVPVAHVEAGLRTGDNANPFPEELNRRVAGVVADIHFAPTPGARDNLLREGLSPSRVVVTGNPILDAIATMIALPFTWPADEAWTRAFEDGRRAIVVTLHRRESFGAPLAGICDAILDVLDACEDAAVVLPVHPNPRVRATVHARLGTHARVFLIDPLDHLTFLHAMRRAYLLVTDSGGVQEEAPSLGTPVLVAREVSERPEGVAAGVARIVGTARERVAAETLALLRDPSRHAAMATGVNPYGDGRAAIRIAESLEAWARGDAVLLPSHLEFGG